MEESVEVLALGLDTNVQYNGVIKKVIDRLDRAGKEDNPDEVSNDFELELDMMQIDLILNSYKVTSDMYLRQISELECEWERSEIEVSERTKEVNELESEIESITRRVQFAQVEYGILELIGRLKDVNTVENECQHVQFQIDELKEKIRMENEKSAQVNSVFGLVQNALKEADAILNTTSSQANHKVPSKDHMEIDP